MVALQFGLSTMPRKLPSIALHLAAGNTTTNSASQSTPTTMIQTQAKSTTTSQIKLKRQSNSHLIKESDVLMGLTHYSLSLVLRLPIAPNNCNNTIRGL